MELQLYLWSWKNLIQSTYKNAGGKFLRKKNRLPYDFLYHYSGCGSLIRLCRGAGWSPSFIRIFIQCFSVPGSASFSSPLLLGDRPRGLQLSKSTTYWHYPTIIGPIRLRMTQDLTEGSMSLSVGPMREKTWKCVGGGQRKGKDPVPGNATKAISDEVGTSSTWEQRGVLSYREEGCIFYSGWGRERWSPVRQRPSQPNSLLWHYLTQAHLMNYEMRETVSPDP